MRVDEMVGACIDSRWTAPGVLLIHWKSPVRSGSMLASFGLFCYAAEPYVAGTFLCIVTRFCDPDFMTTTVTLPPVAPNPIAGVSPQQETTLEFIFPGIACNPLGRLIGSVMGSVQKTGPLPVKLLLLVAVGGLFAPLAAILYFWVKISGTSFTVSNRSVQERPVLGTTLIKQVNFADVAQVDLQLLDSYEFYGVADVRLLDARDAVLMTIPATLDPQRLARLILELRDARAHSAAALKQIQSR